MASGMAHPALVQVAGAGAAAADLLLSTLNRAKTIQQHHVVHGCIHACVHDMDRLCINIVSATWTLVHCVRRRSSC